MEVRKHKPMEASGLWLSKLCDFSSRKFSIFSRNENGSLNVLIIGLFVITVACLMVLTDVSAIFVAKRSLTQATEAAAIRGVHTLDSANYYSGKGTVFTAPLAVLSKREHPSIPIDCERAQLNVALELQNWSSDNGSMVRPELQEIVLTDLACDGTTLEIKTYAEVKFPFTIPFTTLHSAFLTSSAGTTNEVREGLYIFGIRLH